MYSRSNDYRVTRKRKQKQLSEDLAVIVVAVVLGRVTHRKKLRKSLPFTLSSFENKTCERAESLHTGVLSIITYIKIRL